jgi:putative nucleotidyltransferase with HDIG domain
MNRISIVSDSVEQACAIHRRLAGLFESRAFPRQRLPREEPTEYTIVDIDLTNGSHLSDLRSWLTRRPSGAKAIFAVDHGVLRQTVQAFAVGATDVSERPLDRKALLIKLLGDLGSIAGAPLAVPMDCSEGITAAVDALQGIFASVFSGDEIEMKSVEAAADALVSNIENEGLAQWIDVVRSHHSQTYQHSLLVTGVAVEFGRQLGFSRKDVQKLALAGLLHDVGKAGIPVALLEKPAPLDDHELSVMQRHPLLGFETLRDTRGLDPEILDIVVRHHEYLDGSGYPQGLAGRDLSDLVRMITIADVYGALIERRSYKAPMPPKAAYQALEEMGAKLDPDLLREFRCLARI